MRADAKAAQVASIGYTSATHDLEATAATELRKSTSGWREDQERAPGFPTRACYSCCSTFHLTRECPWTIKIGTRNQNTFVVLIICVYVLASKDAIKRGVRVGILLRSRNVDARETSCDRKYVLAAWVRLSSVVFVCRRCITSLSCETCLH